MIAIQRLILAGVACVSVTAVLAACGSSGGHQDEDTGTDVLEDTDTGDSHEDVPADTVVEDTTEEPAENTAPVIEDVSITPDPARVTDTLTCSYTGYSDAEGDPDSSSMSWSVNGETAGTGDTLSGVFEGGDVVTCIVIPYDGTDFGSPEVASVVILDASISGTVWQDEDRSGTFDAGEVGIADHTVYLDDDEDGVKDAGEPSTLSQADGSYSFPDLPAGTYTMALLDLGGWDRTYPAAAHSVDLTSGLVVEDVDFGVAVNAAPSIETVEIDPDPARVGDILTCAYTGYADPEGDLDDSTVSWTINGSAAGTLPVLVGGFAAGDSVECTVTPSDGFNEGTPLSASIVIFDGAIRGTVWVDEDGDGTLDAGEVGVAGRTVYIDADDSGTLDTGELEVVSATDGSFEFPNVPAGTHIVSQLLDGAWSQTFPVETLVISDDFEDGVIDPTLWSTTGDGMSESAGVLHMERNNSADSITLLAALPDSFTFSFEIRPIQVQWRDAFHGFQVDGACIPSIDVKGASFGFTRYGNHYSGQHSCSGTSFDYYNAFTIGTWYTWSAVVSGGSISISVDGTPRATRNVPDGPLTLWLPGYYMDGGGETMTISEVDDFTLSAVSARSHTVVVATGEIVSSIDFGDNG